MRSPVLLLLAALLMIPCLAAAADVAPVAPAPEVAADLLFAAPAAAANRTTAEPALDQLLGAPEPTLMACTITDYCSSCSGGLKFCRRTCCNGSCSTSCGVCGAC